MHVNHYKSFKVQILVILCLISLIGCQLPPVVTPQEWSQSPYASSCGGIQGSVKVSGKSGSVKVLDSQNIFLKESQVYKTTQLVSTQIYYKHFIRKTQGDGGLQTTLEMSRISVENGEQTTQNYILTSNQYQFIDASGPLCLLKLSTGSVDALALYIFDQTERGASLIQLSNQDISSYPNQIFKQLVFTQSTYATENYAGVIGLVKSLDKSTKDLIIRRIGNSGGIDFASPFPLYSFNSDLSLTSETFITVSHALQISDSTYNVYKFIDDSVYELDSALTSGLNVYANHFVMTFILDTAIATWDQSRQNGHIFYIWANGDTFQLEVISMKETTSGELQYYNNQNSFIIELNLAPAASSFYIIWADDFQNYNYTFLNQASDNNNQQIIADFSNAEKITSVVYGSYADEEYTGTLHLYIYKAANIVKYSITVYQADGQTINSITMNKQFAADIEQGWRDQVTSDSYEITTELKCVCSTTSITNFICFYGTDGCTFTVQNLSNYCQP